MTPRTIFNAATLCDALAFGSGEGRADPTTIRLALNFSAAHNCPPPITFKATDRAGDIEGSGMSRLIARLSVCMPVTQDSDLGSHRCLTVRTGGGYDYTNPTLNRTHISTSKTTEMSRHSVSSVFNQVAWLFGDGVQAMDMCNQSFAARWSKGTGNPTIAIKATENSTTSSTGSTRLT